MDPSPLSMAHCESVLHAEMFKLAPSEIIRTAVDKKKSLLLVLWVQRALGGL